MSNTLRPGPDIEGARGVRIPLARPWIDQEEARGAAEVVGSGWLIQGERVALFEERFAAMIGAEHAVAVNSGSSALLVAMAALGVGPGDEVLCPDMTFVSTASAALFLGARPVFVDIELEYYGMDPDRLGDAIGERTKAIVPVHYAGHSAEMAAILEHARARGVAVLEDAAESHLARYEGGPFTGTLGDIGIFSFTPSKPMTTGEGGMIVTDDPGIAEHCRRFRNFGDHGKFEWRELGFNFRMPEAMGAIGLAQLDRLERAVASRRRLGARYNEGLADLPCIEVPRERTGEDGNYQLYTMRVLECAAVARDTLRTELARRGIGSRLYYPALHRQGVFASSEPGPDTEFPNALEFERTALSLPIFPGLSEGDQDEVIGAVRDILKN